MTTLDLTSELPNTHNYDISQNPTESFLYLSTDDPLGDAEVSDVEASVPADTSLLMDLVRRIDENQAAAARERTGSTKFDNDFSNNSAYPSHSTPLTVNRHKPLNQPSESDKLFKMYQPLVTEELRLYINKLVLQKASSGGLGPIDELQEREYKSGGSNHDNSNSAHVSPDTTPPTSQDQINEGKQSGGAAAAANASAIPALTLSEIPEPESESDSGSISVSVSQSDTDFDTSYVPKSVKSKLGSPDLEDRPPPSQLDLVEQIENLENFQKQMEERYQIEISQLKKQLERLDIMKNEQLEHLKEENLNLRVRNGELEIALMKEEEKQNEKLGFENHDKLDTLLAKVDLLIKENSTLKNKLSNSKIYNAELNNEISFLRNKNDLVIPETPVREYSVSSKSVDETDDLQQLITKNTVEPQFREQYTKLKLDDIDNLSKVELNNLIKSIMLTLLIGDLSTLPTAIKKLAKILKVSTIFIDRIHGVVYDENDGVKPSKYIRAPHEATDVDRLENCLGALARKIEQSNAK